jgi:hypothetical protein
MGKPTLLQKSSVSSKMTLWKLSHGHFLTGDFTKAMGIIMELKNTGCMSWGMLPIHLGSSQKGWTIHKKVDDLECYLKSIKVDYTKVDKDQSGRLCDDKYGLVFGTNEKKVRVIGMLDYHTDQVVDLDENHQKVKNVFRW